MSYSNWERATDIENARQELREAREEILKKEEAMAKDREQKKITMKFKGEENWIHPSISEKLDKMSATESSSSKKSKKSKKKSKKKHKKKSKRKYESDSSEEEKIKKIKKRHRTPSTSSSSSDSESEDGDDWIEKPKIKETERLVREDWLSGVSFMSYSKQKTEPKKAIVASYDPSKCARELNPHWKNGGTGVPTFQKPSADSDDEKRISKDYQKPGSSGNWRKKNDDMNNFDMKSVRNSEAVVKGNSRNVEQVVYKLQDSSRTISSSGSDISDNEINQTALSDKEKPAITDFLTDQQMNELGAKLIKAEILGNDTLANELKEKLDKARECRNNYKQKSATAKVIHSERLEKDAKNEVEQVLLMKTSKSGISRPLECKDPYGNTKRSGKNKSKAVSTHQNNERVRHFHDDDKYNLKQMFESEKFVSGSDQDAEFAKIMSKHKNRNDDIDDIFSDAIRKETSDSKTDERERNQAIREHQKTQSSMENCNKCFDSNKMEKQLIIAMGKNVYLSLYPYEGLQRGHCLIVPMQHVSCSTDLDEDVWEEINDFRKALTNMFASRSQDVVFFETAKYLHRRPHMAIHVIPNRNFELLPFYFKKAIQESESDWAHNKQLISLKKEKGLRRSIPKGLPYFWANFGMESGFAHVIEDQERFPGNFAEEIIGGLLNLDSRVWRRPRKENNPIPKVKQFVDWWKPFDITT